MAAAKEPGDMAPTTKADTRDAVQRFGRETPDLNAALSKAQAKIQHASASGENPHFRSRYPRLSDVWDVLREPLHEQGLSVTQRTAIRDSGDVVLVTELRHVTGQTVASEYPVRPVKADPQGWGSALTYARRYTLMAVAGVCSVEDDDDGNAASNRAAAPAARAPSQEQARAAFAPVWAELQEQRTIGGAVGVLMAHTRTFADAFEASDSAAEAVRAMMLALVVQEENGDDMNEEHTDAE